MQFTQDIHKRHFQNNPEKATVNAWEKMQHIKANKKKAGAVTLIAEKSITGDKKGPFIMKMVQSTR